MRNLRGIHYDVCHAATAITAVCWDAGQDESIVAFGPTEDEPRVRLARVVGEGRSLTCRDIAAWDALSPNPDTPVDRIVDMHYFGDLSTVCVILAGGDLVMVREAAAGGFDDPVHVELVGSVDPGIAAARWSPDEEVLALVTTGSTLLLMSREFETIGETPLSPADLATSKHVSVGWGKKETQFKGRGAAKIMRDPTIPEVVDEGTLSPADDSAAVAISWRGDGAFVAVNAVEQVLDEQSQDGHSSEQRRRRVVRVYSREGVLDSASEPVDGLEGLLSWRPSGNLLATVQRKAAPADSNEQYNVIFFERNGLRHGEFALRPPQPLPSTFNPSNGPVRLDWNSDSTVLAITYANAVQLWTMGNYHWYLKQEVATQCPRGNRAEMQPQQPQTQLPLTAWHPEKPLRLLASTSSGLMAAEYIFAVASGSLVPPHDHGAVAVIDGQTIKLTPMRFTNIPPPMSLYSVSIPSPAVDVAIATGDDAFAVLCRTGISVFSWSWPSSVAPSTKRPPPPQLVASFVFSDDVNTTDLTTPLQACFLRDESNTVLFVLGWAGDALCVTTFDVALDQGRLAYKTTQTAPPGSNLVASSRGHGVYVQSFKGIISPLSPHASSHTSSLDSFSPFAKRLVAFSPWATVVDADQGDTKIAIGLSRNGHLYSNEQLLAKNCTSFLVTPDHLIFTTTNHLLKFVHLTDGRDFEVPTDDPETDERCRSIEQGARLVTAVPSNLNVVLQMPRGNLETIFPRAMVVAGIRKLIDEVNYGQAFAFCRTQRVDMNILYDHNPEQFVAKTGLFLDQLKDATSIDLFLSSLREEDVTKTMYKDTKQAAPTGFSGQASFARPHQPAPPQSSSAASKVNTVCDAVLESLAQRKKTHLQNTITAHVCKAPPALDDGLRVVAQLLQEDAAAAERAVEHMCFLVDVNRLYDHALGLYNLDLTLLVAQQAQRDPREYVPFIQDLHALPELRRRFAIDDHLARYEKALAHLKALDDTFPDVLAYTDKHGLYKEALRLYRYDEERLAAVTNLYAEHLEKRSRFREAGLAYESLGLFSKAMGCYQAAGVSCWRECLFAAQRQDPPPKDEALRELAATLADALLEARDYAAAATLQLEYLSSVEAGVRSLCQAYEFAEAMRVALRYGRPDLLETGVDAGLAEALSSSTELLADCRAQLKAQVPRILELRRRAIEDPLGFFEGGDRNASGDVPDDVSVATSSRISTSASLFTRYSTGTAGTGQTGQTGQTMTTQHQRSRKKREEKKRARGRKGTVYEQAYLVNSVRRLVERVERARAEVQRLVEGLARRKMAERARAIETLMADLIEACQTAIGEVWPDSSGSGSGGGAVSCVGNVGGPDLSVGEDTGGSSEPSMADPGEGAAPVIAPFQRLTLLG